MPRRASSAALTPPSAAQPQWMRLTVPPVRFASMTPPAMLTAIPIAEATPSASRPSKWAAAAALPIAPQMEVACCPCSKKVELPRSRS